jgi:hypothetical protein
VMFLSLEGFCGLFIAKFVILTHDKNEGDAPSLSANWTNAIELKDEL